MSDKVRIRFFAANGKHVIAEMDSRTWKVLEEQIENAQIKKDWTAVFAVLALGIKTKSIVEIKEQA